MASVQEEDEEWDEEDEDSDAFDDDDIETIPCPYCREEIAEDSPRCPHCEGYISKEDAPGTSQPLWIIVTALVCLLMMLSGILLI